MLPIKAWRFIYADGSVFDSTMGRMSDAPPFGVQAVVHYHVAPYKTLAGPDASGVYTYHGAGEKEGCTMGLWQDDEGYYRILDMATRSVSP